MKIKLSDIELEIIIEALCTELDSYLEIDQEHERVDLIGTLIEDLRYYRGDFQT